MTSSSKSGPETRAAILDAAEWLFAEHGLEATTLRMITGRAGVNLASVNYHFGGREALIHEVFRRRLSELNRRRLAALERFRGEVGDAPLRPSRILVAFFGTAVEMAQDVDHGGQRFMRLLGRTYSEPSEFVRTFLADEYAECIDRFRNELYRALPDVPREEILWRFHFMMGAMAYAIAGGDPVRLFGDASGAERPSRLLPRLLSFLIGGLRAPLACDDRELREDAARMSNN